MSLVLSHALDWRSVAHTPKFWIGDQMLILDSVLPAVQSHHDHVRLPFIYVYMRLHERNQLVTELACPICCSGLYSAAEPNALQVHACGRCSCNAAAFMHPCLLEVEADMSLTEFFVFCWEK